MQGLSKDWIGANFFRLSGDSISVDYVTGTQTGSSLSYRDDELDRRFTDEEFEVEDTRLGQLITVTLREIPDFEVVTFTLVLPAIAVTDWNTPIDIKVAGITVTHRTTIAGPQPGQQTFYSLVTLTGNAEAAVF
jgi:hypothetical protein